MKKRQPYPTKNTLNLMVIERPAARVWRMTPIIIIAIIAIAAFCKFAVVDRLSAADKARTEAIAAESRLASVQEQLVGYDEVEREYTRYFSDALATDPALMPLDCMEALKLVESNVMNHTSVSSINFSGSMVTMQLTGITLDQASSLIAKLDKLENVSGVNLYTANTGSTKETDFGATILLTITFREVED